MPHSSPLPISSTPPSSHMTHQTNDKQKRANENDETHDLITLQGKNKHWSDVEKSMLDANDLLVVVGEKMLETGVFGTLLPVIEAICGNLSSLTLLLPPDGPLEELKQHLLTKVATGTPLRVFSFMDNPPNEQTLPQEDEDLQPYVQSSGWKVSNYNTILTNTRLLIMINETVAYNLEMDGSRLCCKKMNCDCLRLMIFGVDQPHSNPQFWYDTAALANDRAQSEGKKKPFGYFITYNSPLGQDEALPILTQFPIRPKECSNWSCQEVGSINHVPFYSVKESFRDCKSPLLLFGSLFSASWHSSPRNESLGYATSTEVLELVREIKNQKMVDLQRGNNVVVEVLEQSKRVAQIRFILQEDVNVPSHYKGVRAVSEIWAEVQ